ncbi:MAG TPA: DUF1259 domain-containing protein [Paenibacillus sp.]|nr:DUF1259 domain-containing protein [Paenibacillus sp.]
MANSFAQTCEQFGKILGGMHTSGNGVCTVMKSRTNIQPKVLGRRAKSFLLIPQMFSFESMTKDGKALCSGETVILASEINRFTSRLRKHGIIITSVHNHWLFDNPRLMYMHWEAIDRPAAFARKTKDALSVLTAKVVKAK